MHYMPDIFASVVSIGTLYAKIKKLLIKKQNVLLPFFNLFFFLSFFGFFVVAFFVFYWGGGWGCYQNKNCKN